MKYSIGIVLTLCLVLDGMAQGNKCFSDEYFMQKLSSNENLAIEAEEMYKRAHQRYENSSGKSRQPLVTIPVVVHIVYNQSSDNLSDARIQSQIDVLNEDYRRTNSDASQTPSLFSGLGADSEIEFCLAAIDPNGNATDGIVRMQTSVSQFNVSSDEIKYASQGGSNGWDRDQYLNIWVGRLQGGILGYASFPNAAWTAAEDGVVIGTPYFGRGFSGISSQYSEGRTCTHEVGHWLGLRHIWGDGACSATDNVSDTPSSEDPYYNCPNMGSSSTSCSSQDMFMNYMDYVDDDCMNLFTHGQKAVMQDVLSGFRSSLAQSVGCAPDFALDMEVLFTGSQGISCSSNYTVVVQVRNNGSTPITNATIEYSVNDGPSNNYQWNGNLAAGQFENVTLYSAVLSGSQEVEVEITSVNGGSDQYTANNIASTTFQGIVLASAPLTESFDDTTFDQPGWSIVDPDNDEFTWLHNGDIGAYGSNDGTAVFDNYNGSTSENPGGTIDEIITPFNDVSGISNTSISFDYAYAYYDDGSEVLIDGLSVSYSTNCGDTWNQAWFKEGSDLATAVPHTEDFFPTSNEWTSINIDLVNLGSASTLLIKFTNHSGWGNRLWLDNININTLVNVPEALSADFNISLFPNPSNDGMVSLSREKISETFTVEVLNLQGQTIHKSLWTDTELKLDLLNQENGMYLVRVSDGSKQLTHKLLLNK